MARYNVAGRSVHTMFFPVYGLSDTEMDTKTEMRGNLQGDSLRSRDDPF